MSKLISQTKYDSWNINQMYIKSLKQKKNIIGRI